MAVVVGYYQDISDDDLEDPNRRFVVVTMPMFCGYRLEWLPHNLEDPGMKRPPVLHSASLRGNLENLSVVCDELNDKGAVWAKENF